MWSVTQIILDDFARLSTRLFDNWCLLYFTAFSSARHLANLDQVQKYTQWVWADWKYETYFTFWSKAKPSSNPIMIWHIWVFKYLTWPKGWDWFRQWIISMWFTISCSGPGNFQSNMQRKWSPLKLNPISTVLDGWNFCGHSDQNFRFERTWKNRCTYYYNQGFCLLIFGRRPRPRNWLRKPFLSELHSFLFSEGASLLVTATFTQFPDPPSINGLVTRPHQSHQGWHQFSQSTKRRRNQLTLFLEKLFPKLGKGFLSLCNLPYGLPNKILSCIKSSEWKIACMYWSPPFFFVFKFISSYWYSYLAS